MTKNNQQYIKTIKNVAIIPWAGLGGWTYAIDLNKKIDPQYPYDTLSNLLYSKNPNSNVWTCKKPIRPIDFMNKQNDPGAESLRIFFEANPHRAQDKIKHCLRYTSSDNGELELFTAFNINRLIDRVAIQTYVTKIDIQVEVSADEYNEHYHRQVELRRNA